MNPQNAHAHEDRLLDFAYGELPLTEARAMEAHLSGCARCTQALDDIRGVRATMSQLSEEPAPDAGLESLLAYAQQAARRAAAGPAPRPSRWRRWLLPVVGLASVATFGILALQSNDPALTHLDSNTLKSEAAKDAAPAPAGAAPTAVAENVAPPPPPPAPVAQAMPAELEQDKVAAKEGVRPEDWRSAGSGGGEIGTGATRESEWRRKSKREPKMASKVAPSKFAEEKASLDEENLDALAARDAEGGTSSLAQAPKQEALKVGGVKGRSYAADEADDSDGLAGASLAKEDSAYAEAGPATPAPAALEPAAAPAAPAPSRADVAIATGAVASREVVAERRAPAPSEMPAKKAKPSAATSAPAAMSPARARAEPGPSVEELSRQAQEAYDVRDRAQEAALLRSALATGVTGSVRLGLLNRLCDAELALGLVDEGTATCKRVISEAPGSSAAKAASRRLANLPTSKASGLEAAPKSADPSK